MPGAITLGTEVTNLSRYCVWMLIDDEELALPYSEALWLKEATIQQILNVLRPTADHLYWPDLDVDLSVESIRHPENFPLGEVRVFSRPHPSPDTDKGAIASIRKWLEEHGVTS
ncbi:DUF2442 domain-containing protein [Cyanobium sp. BA20m-14]|uniref:DUF2442 domain-containing protein n=1 Tax=Cyanobium sp. BA20m-14 TaxID=2823703 RepID=UPI0020CEAF67|nr:DUF2442 domain-containing protein [Cyanobium sp. BA20m-14]MCP9912699.1 DUF2442 domain-containing protein [Cyanobium sp. BA20m-14]